jgi:hypothetical protein
MGVIINETITLNTGLTVTNAYASMGDSDIKVEKQVKEDMNYDILPKKGEPTFTTKYISRVSSPCGYPLNCVCLVLETLGVSKSELNPKHPLQEASMNSFTTNLKL